MTAFYNEHDPFAAAWLRELIKTGLIAPGVVDERSIEDVLPNELAGYTQCHFFAGIGVWSYALRLAGWSDDRPVWTGSCPCQPFSAAGQRTGFADERHLWPAWFHLIGQCKPPIIFGEQVASKSADAWIDLVHTDMEAVGYAFGAIPFPSAGIGAPHIRDRLYWLADSASGRQSGGLRERGSSEWPEGSIGRHGAAGGMAESAGDGCAGGWSSGAVEARSAAGRNAQGQTADERGEFQAGLEGSGVELSGGMADNQCAGSQRGLSGGADTQRQDQHGHAGCGGSIVRPGPTNGFWRDADWLGCKDGKWRPVEPGTFPLANGAVAKMGRLRGYGNAINAVAAQTFITSYLETLYLETL
jgi:DNA (cytosine-5)-methyltransferase 1